MSLPPWRDLPIPDSDFDIGALYTAIDERRAGRKMSWKSVAQEVNPVSPSTLRGLKTRRWGIEGDGVLQMLRWLDRSPESFVPGHPGAAHPDARLPRIDAQEVLRFDVPLIGSKLDALRTARGLSWAEVAAELGGLCTADQLRNMRHQQRAAFPQVMRLARWLRCPAAALTKIVRG